MNHTRSLLSGLILSLAASSVGYALSPRELQALRTEAENGSAIAQYNLGLAYADNSEAPYNLAEAYVWLSLAAQNGATGTALDTVTKQLTPEQLSEAQQRLRYEADLRRLRPARLQLPSTTLPSAAAAAANASPVSATPSPVSPLIPVEDPAEVAAKLRAQIEKLSADLAAATKAADELKSAQTGQLSDLNKRIAIAEAALASKDKEIAALKDRPPVTPEVVPADLAQLRADLAQLRAERAQLRNESATALSNQLAQFERTRAELTDQLQAAQKEIAALKQAGSSSDQLARDLATARTAVDASVKELAATKAQLAALQSSQTDAAGARTELARLGSTIKLLEQDKTGLAIQLAEYKDSTEKTIAGLTARLAATSAELAATRLAATAAPVAPTPEPVVAAPAAPAASSEELAALTTRAETAEKATAETDAKLAAALRTYTLQQAEVDRLQKALANIDGEREGVATKLAAAEAELATLRPQAAAGLTATTEADTLRSSLAATTRTAEDRAATLARLEQEAAQLRATTANATAEVSLLREQMRQTQAQTAVLATENNQLKTRLALTGSPAGTTLASPTRPGAPVGALVSFPTANPATVSTAPAPQIIDDAPVAAPATEERTHIVAAGDSFSRIARRYYGDASRWAEIYDANRAIVSSPNALKAGTRLRIP